MTERTLPHSWTVLRRSATAFLGAVLALQAVVAVAAPPVETPPFKPSPAASLPFAALALGVGANPATASLSLAGLQAVNEMGQNQDPRVQTSRGTATLVFMGGTPAVAPLTELALLQGGDRGGCWLLINTNLARPIPSQFLSRFHEWGPLPELTSNVLEYDALSYALLLAAKNSPAAFRASVNPRLTFAKLFEQPRTHCGQVVHVEGDAQWVRKLETPALLKEAGIENLYEVWIINKAVGPRPYCVLLTELPADLPVGKRLDVPVVLNGYFIKRRREKADAVPQESWNESLLIAGRSLTVQKLLTLLVTAEGRRAVGAATLVMSGAGAPSWAPLTEVSLLDHGERVGCWKLANSDIVRPIPPETLAKIRDGKTLPSSASEGQEFDALLDVLTQTWHTSPRAFEKAARHHVSFGQLFKHPNQFRGEMVHIEGRLRLLQPWEPPLLAREAGVPLMYEAAIFDDASGSNPYIVFVMDRPEGVPLNEKISETVSFDGYFYKKWRYKSLDSLKANEYREAPLLIGRSLKVPDKDAAVANGADELPAWAMFAAAGVVAVLTLGVVLMFVLAFWLRRGDARVQERLHAVRTSRFTPPPADGNPPLATPVQPPGGPHSSDPP